MVRYITAGGSPSNSRSRSKGGDVAMRSPSRGRSKTRRALVVLGNQIRPGLGTAGDVVYSIGKRAFSTGSNSHVNKRRSVSEPPTPPPSAPRRGRSRKSKSTVYHTTGGYGGKFSNRRFSDPFKVYGNKGIYVVNETTGTVTDPNCVYINYTSVDGYAAVNAIIVALMRKLFQKKGYVISDINEELGRLTLSNAEGWIVTLTVLDETTGLQTIAHSYTTVAGSTLQMVADSFFSQFLDYSAGFGLINPLNAKRLCQLILYNTDYAPVANQTVFECSLNLADEIVHLKGKCELKIQNRTKAANSSTSAEDVTNNPLCGFSYRFNSQPKTRDKALFILNTIGTGSGVRLMRASQLAANSPYREPPLPGIFMNCVSSSKQMLGPGEVRKAKCGFVKSMHLLTMLKKICVQYNVNADAQTSNSPFPCELFALEDLINVNPTERISIAYEANHYLGVFCTTSKKKTALAKFVQHQVDNVTPPP